MPYRKQEEIDISHIIEMIRQNISKIEQYSRGRNNIIVLLPKITEKYFLIHFRSMNIINFYSGRNINSSINYMGVDFLFHSPDECLHIFVEDWLSYNDERMYFKHKIVNFESKEQNKTNQQIQPN